MVLFAIVRFRRFRALVANRFIGLSPRKNRENTWISIGTLAISFILGYILFQLFNPLFAALFTEGNANYYGNILAWVVAIAVPAFCFEYPINGAIGILFPALCLELGFAKLACFCGGCCHSFAMDSFYFNVANQRTEFPIQLVESLVGFLLFALVLLYQKETHNNGKVLPFYCVVYSASRFITEFLRDDLPPVLGIFDAYQLMSVACLVLGVLLYFINSRFRPNQEASPFISDVPSTRFAD